MNAIEFFGLTIIERENGMALVGDGNERYWVAAKALEEEFDPSHDEDETRKLYDAWCGKNAREK